MHLISSAVGRMTGTFLRILMYCNTFRLVRKTFWQREMPTNNADKTTYNVDHDVYV